MIYALWRWYNIGVQTNERERDKAMEEKKDNKEEPTRGPTKVWEDPDPDVELTEEDRRHIFGDGTPDTRTDEERKKEWESWALD